MKQVKIIIGNEEGCVPRDVIREAVRYIMDKTNYKPTTVKRRKRKPTSRKAK